MALAGHLCLRKSTQVEVGEYYKHLFYMAWFENRHTSWKLVSVMSFDMFEINLLLKYKCILYIGIKSREIIIS